MANILLKTVAGRVGAIVGGAIVALGLWVGLGGLMGAAPRVPDAVTCLPTCDIDGRSFVVAGDDPTTLSAQAITIGFQHTAGETHVNFEIFDADHLTNWDTPLNCGAGCVDNGSPGPKLLLTLYRDPAGDGTGVVPANVVATWTPEGPPGVNEQGPFAATNNSWSGDSVPRDENALGLDGNYHYALVIAPFSPSTNKGWNAFKIRGEGTVTLLGNQIVGFIAAMNVGAGDSAVIYPNGFPDQTGTPYNGAWIFTTTLPPFLDDVTVFDGDMDFGNSACTYKDTDDGDSVGIPPFAAGSAAVAEGVAVANPGPNQACTIPANGLRTGTPSEDGDSAGNLRVPTIVPAGIAYLLRAPDGQVFLNQNPSGNKEWEQFRIQKVANAGDIPGGIACPVGGFAASGPYLASDCRTTSLPGGNWQVELDGMDLNNLNFWFFSFKVEVPPTEYSIGRLVWYDADSDGVQDMCGMVPCAAEPGIANVAYTVYLGPVGDGNIVAVGVTDADGEFFHGVMGTPSDPTWPAGDYSVVVDASNFNPGGPLFDHESTTGGETQTGIEVGLPVCTDTNVPVGCGQPVYAEALFGYVVKKNLECIIDPNNGPPFIGAVHTWSTNPNGTITLRTTLSKLFVDNTYGVNKIGWNNHMFHHLVTSDHIRLALYDTNEVKRLEFNLDYLSAAAGAPGGYRSLGITGGDGNMLLGNPAAIVGDDSSLEKNFRDGMVLTVNSPATDASYTPNPAFPNWIFDVWYEVTFRPAPFGQAGFGYPRLTSVHASPSKTGKETEPCIYPDDLPSSPKIKR